MGTLSQTLTNSASLDFVDQGDTNAANDAASAAVQVQPSADLVLAAVASTTTPREGDFVYYTITDRAINAGPEDASGVQVTDLLPSRPDIRQRVAKPRNLQPHVRRLDRGQLAKGDRLSVDCHTHHSSPRRRHGRPDGDQHRCITAEDQLDPRLANNTAAGASSIGGRVAVRPAANTTFTASRKALPSPR